MAWQQFVMQLDALPPDTVEEIFQRHGAHSVTLSDAGDSPVLEPAPGETPLWPETQISGLFSHGADLAALRDELLRCCKLRALPAHRIEALPERDWVTEWRRDSRPLRFGRRLWVAPDDFVPQDDAAVVLRLDPGLAFGSGTHATTALCLEWLDGLSLQGLRLLDYGCGSGILSLAALKLGAHAACAVDIDPQAITATRANARRNSVAERLTALRDGAQLAGQFDVVIANILAGPLTELAPALCACMHSGSKLALSGILDTQADAVMQAYRPWIEFQPVVTQAGWVRLTGVRN
ncbi:MAG: 50S ribosomal protein L11 methyltransferase [Gammaproteobacteria bacterium]|nr:MAG: 50S ribosomal protein L11 methyltransferase [Gammaproteobacteria bacterium]